MAPPPYRMFQLAALLAALTLPTAFAANAAKKAKAAALNTDLSAPVALPPDLVFNDAWSAKLVGTPAGNAYNPALVDWSSVIESLRAIMRYETRIANWCTRAAFHDGGSHEIVTKGTGRNRKVLVVPPGAGGVDASLLLTLEQLREENSYDAFSTFVAATVRKLVGFYDVSYADGLAVCGAVAREILSKGRSPVTDFMPAIDTSNVLTPRVPFLVGRLDTLEENGAGILPGATFNVDEFAAWFEKHFDRGVFDGIALLGSHGTLDNQHCVKTDTGPFKGVQRMFSWQASKTYFAELLTPALKGPVPDLSMSSYKRSDPMDKELSISDIEQCKFTSKEFKDEVRRSVESDLAAEAAGQVVAADPLEPSFDWVDPLKEWPADEPEEQEAPEGPEVPDTPEMLALEPELEAAELAAEEAAAAAAAQPSNDEFQAAAAAAQAQLAALEAQMAALEAAAAAAAAADPNAPVDPAEPVHPPRPAGVRFRRTCDLDKNCYDGWPYTQNDGFLGKAAQEANATSSRNMKAVRNAVLKFRDNPAAWDAAYGNAFNRLLNNGAMFSPMTKKGKGLEINGFECVQGWWVSGAGSNAAQNAKCHQKCGVAKKCTDVWMTAPLSCRCSTSPWGDIATQRLYPNSTQTAVGDVKATPSGLSGGGRKLLQNAHAAGFHAAASDAHRGGKPRAKCPMALLRAAGLLS